MYIVSGFECKGITVTARILDGNALAQRLQIELAEKAAQFTAQFGHPPKLSAVLASDDPASAQYVRMKRRDCKKVGIISETFEMDASSTQEQVEETIASLNHDPRVHGILVQLPLPPQIDEERALQLVALPKDVDGFHPINIGKLAMKGREPSFAPATPSGCMELLKEAGVNLSGANAVVLGRSNIVGLPMAMMLVKANATVTICHSRTQDLTAQLRRADVVIAAIGRPNFVQADWLNENAVVIDVGTNRIDDPSDKRGYRWVGDVDFEAAVNVVRAISKVPGGVGPMTRTMLLVNTIRAAWRQAEIA